MKERSWMSKNVFDLFEIKCKKCGSNIIKIKENEIYDGDDCYCGSEFYLECIKCNNCINIRGES